MTLQHDDAPQVWISFLRIKVLLYCTVQKVEWLRRYLPDKDSNKLTRWGDGPRDMAIPGSPFLSLVGTATSMIFVMTKHIRISLSWQSCVCCDKHIFIATKDAFRHDKHVCWRLLWQKSYLWQLPPMTPSNFVTTFTRSMVSRFHWAFLPHIFSQHEKSLASIGCAYCENVQRSTHSVEYEGKPHRESGPPSHPEQHKDDGDVDQRVGDIQPWRQQKNKQWGKPLHADCRGLSLYF